MAAERGNFQIRSFQGEPNGPELRELMTLASASWGSARSPFAAYHPGDLCWRMRDPGYPSELHLWYAGKELVGFCECDPDSGALETQRAVPQDRELLKQIIAWAEGQTDRPLTVSGPNGDDELLSVLKERGYERVSSHWHNCHSRDLKCCGRGGDLAPPPGYTFRSLGGDDELERRAQVHRDGWESTLMTLEKYQRLTATPGYRLELDLVAVAPDGSFAACCNCWFDQSIGAGLFEPVSTAPLHRRKGVGAGLIRFGLTQLQQLGAQTAWVNSYSQGNATSLYERCGLQVVWRTYDYQKPSGS